MSCWILRRISTGFASQLIGAIALGFAIANVVRADNVAEDTSPTVDFAKQIRPILSDSCFACHGPDRSGQMNDLRLDVRADAIESAIVPGDASASELIRRVTSSDPDIVMPPPDSNRKQLSKQDVEVLGRWIVQGAPYDDHWAYQLPRRIDALNLATSASDARLANDIDRFVVAKYTELGEGIQQAPKADRRTLIRRLSFDLLGLPPSPEQVRAFENDLLPNAYLRLVDAMLESESFGERMATVWLDLVRFADTCGYHGDQHRDVDAFRDYVIDSFNKNKPFDQFTIEQLAGDLLSQPTEEQLIATAYNRLLQTTREGGAQPKEYRAIYDADRVRNVTTVWLGSTLGCAQCHDHKFDPFSTADFYRFASFFADVKEIEVGEQPDNFVLADPNDVVERDRLDGEINKLKANLKAARDALKEKDTGEGKSTVGKLQDTLKSLEARKDKVDSRIRKLLITERTTPRMTRVLPRGNWLDETGAVVQPAIPEVFGSVVERPGERATRMDLAQWLVSDKNPLTARVFVNHLWKVMFGKGLVRTPDDFGSQGEFPTHLELLDWLAVEFQNSGWNIKYVLRLIAASETYQQQSDWTPRMREADPYNKYLARQNTFRMDAEMVRDNALAVSGLLVHRVGGVSVKPYQPVGYWSQLNFPKRRYQADDGANQHRRGVYTYWCRTFLHPSFAAFDAPTREECTASRTRSNTPLQALVLLNDPSYVEAARALGKRIVELGGTTASRTVDLAFQQVLTRSPNDVERRLLEQLYEQQRQRYQVDPNSARALIGEESLGDKSGTTAAAISLARVMLNLHETITRK